MLRSYLTHSTRPAQAPARRRGAVRALVILCLGLLGGAPFAQDQPELRVCSDPDAYPVSSRERPGYENRIAAILADELGMRLTYEWTRIDAYTVRTHLHGGACDVVMGAAEGAEGILNTVAYHRAPFVFVHREDGSPSEPSLSADALEGARIAVPPNGLAEQALSEIGVTNVTNVQRRLEAKGAGRIAPLVEAVARGDADAAIVYAPGAWQAARAADANLTVTPVTPEIVPPLLRMFRLVTIGVRPHDAALRDTLNRALARRWSDVQAVFEAFDVAASSLSQPREGALPPPEAARVAMVAPFPTSRPRATDRLADTVQMGAEVAESQIARERAENDPEFHVSLANAPTAEAARRAAERLAHRGHVDALVGGVSDAQARALAEVAEAADVPFFNVASPDPALRRACRPTSFHVQPSTGMYLEGLAAWLVERGGTRWAIVHGEGDGERLDRAERAIARHAGAEIAATVEAPTQFADYGSQIERIREAGADVGLVFLTPEAQEFFLGQAYQEAPDVTWTGHPYPVMQTRDAYVRLRDAVGGEPLLRLAPWDASLEGGGAEAWNDTFASRSGSPLDPTGWATMAAVHTFYAAARELGGEASTEAWIDTLESREAVARKGGDTAFEPGTHQLRQPLYGVRVDPEAPWDRHVSAQEALASVVDTVNATTVAAGAGTEACD